jgi:endonuclease/exonuclease/phosphatase family metal-dependent hydrolase
MSRWFPRRLAVVLLASVLVSVSAAGCDWEAVELAIKQTVENKPSGGTSAPVATAPVAKSPDRITVASFNVQVFGQGKLDRPEVMEVITGVVRRFDVIAIQEVRSKEQDVIPELVRRVNADGSRYDYVIGERLGRTSSREQYAFVYDTSRLEVLPQSVYTVDDPRDELHREPLVTTFRVRDDRIDDPFSFTLVNIHTDPDEVDAEVDALAEVFLRVQGDRIGEDDVILLGDLNADEYHLGRLGSLPSIATAIRGTPTNTRRTESYDNLVFDRRATVEYTGQAGVLDLESEFRLTRDEALEVSDHLPVWAVFSATESAGGSLAGREPAPRR